MPFSLTSIHQQDHLFLITDGSIETVEEHLEWCRNAWDTAQESGCRKFLIDNRMLSIGVTREKVLVWGNKLPNIGMDIENYQLAILPSLKTPTISGVIETILIDQLAAYKRFDNRKEAIKWLLSI